MNKVNYHIATNKIQRYHEKNCNYRKIMRKLFKSKFRRSFKATLIWDDLRKLKRKHPFTIPTSCKTEILITRQKSLNGTN